MLTLSTTTCYEFITKPFVGALLIHGHKTRKLSKFEYPSIKPIIHVCEAKEREYCSYASDSNSLTWYTTKPMIVKQLCEVRRTLRTTYKTNFPGTYLTYTLRGSKKKRHYNPHNRMQLTDRERWGVSKHWKSKSSIETTSAAQRYAPTWNTLRRGS